MRQLSIRNKMTQKLTTIDHQVGDGDQCICGKFYPNVYKFYTARTVIDMTQDRHKIIFPILFQAIINQMHP